LADLPPEPSPVVFQSANRSGVDADAASAHTGRRKAVSIVVFCSVAVLVVLCAILVPTIGVIGAPIGAAVAIAVGMSLWFGSTSLLLRSLRTTGADELDEPRVFNLVDGLCATMGLPPPEIQLVDDPLPGALAIGLDADRAVLVLTTGLLSALDPVELEGVLAHELSHIKRGDNACATVAPAAVLPIARAVPPARASLGNFVHRMAGRGREFEADRRAVSVTRYPPGLRQALCTLTEAPDDVGVRAASTLTSRPVVQVTRWLWTVPFEFDGPRSSGRAADTESGHAGATGELDAPDVRIAALDEW